MSDISEDVESSGSKQPNRLLILAVLALVILLIQLPNLLIRNVYIRNYKSTDDWMVYVVLPAIILSLMIGFTIVFVGLTPKLAAFECRWFRWSRREFIEFLLLPFGIITSVLIVRFLGYRFGLPGTEPATRFENGSYVCYYIPLFVWLIIRTSILGPVVEEIFWRGYVQSTLMRICHPVLAVMGQAALFGLVHFRPVLGFLQVFLFGLIFGIWCYRRKTLLPVIIMHIAFNSFMVLNECRDWYEVRQIKITHNYVAEFIELSKPAGYDPNDDAREDYAKAGQLVVEFPDELKEVRKSYPTQWNKEERAQAEAWVKSNTKALDFIEKGIQKPYYWIVYEHKDATVLSVLPRDLDKIRHFAFSLCMRAMMQTDQGRYEQGFDDVETCYKLGRHLAPGKDLLPRLVAYAVYECAVQTTRMILANEDINPVLLIRLQRQFETFAHDNERGFDFTETRLMYMDIIQLFFTDDGQGGGYIPRSAFKKHILPGEEFESAIGIISMDADFDASKWRKLERRITTADVNRYCNLSEKACLLSPWQYNRNVDRIKTTIEKIEERNPLIKTFSPAIDRLVEIAARFRADQDALIATLGILRYKADSQKLPRDLSELVDTGYLETVPDDPFSEGSITYKLTDEGFILYSFGADFDDDGGTPSKWGYGEKGGDQLFWPIQEFDDYSEAQTETKTE